MKAKWYLGTFIVVLTLLGASLQQFSVPNQEIVVQFANDEVATFETQNTIAIVKKQLQDIGVDNIQIHEEAHGKLKITYYSNVDVTSIKKIFLEKELEFGLTSLYNQKKSTKSPSSKNSNTYKLDVFEIQKSNDVDWGLNGYVLELKPKNDRYFKPDVYFPYIEIDVKKKNRLEKTAYIVHKNISIAIDNSTFNIPEVRAGPITNIIS